MKRRLLKKKYKDDNEYIEEAIEEFSKLLSTNDISNDDIDTFYTKFSYSKFLVKNKYTNSVVKRYLLKYNLNISVDAIYDFSYAKLLLIFNKIDLLSIDQISKILYLH